MQQLDSVRSQMRTQEVELLIKRKSSNLDFRSQECLLFFQLINLKLGMLLLHE